MTTAAGETSGIEEPRVDARSGRQSVSGLGGTDPFLRIQ